MFAGFRATFSIPQRAGGLHFLPLRHGAAVSLDRFGRTLMITSQNPCTAQCSKTVPKRPNMDGGSCSRRH